MARVTFATMQSYIDGITYYKVYQGNLRKDNTIHFNRRTVAVGAYKVGPEPFCYRCAELNHATETAPVVPWASHNHTCKILGDTSGLGSIIWRRT